MTWLKRILLLLSMSLTGCTWFKAPPVPVQFSSKELVVSSPVLMRADQYSAWFQYGKQVTQGQLTIWDDYCKVLLQESRPESWYWEDGRYRITGYSWYDDMCTRKDCDFVQRFQLETLSGLKAAELTCTYRYAFGDIQDISGPHLLSPQDLDAILGDYLNLIEKD